MSDKKVVSLTQKKQEKQEISQESEFSNLCHNFDDYLDFWLDNTVIDPENHPVSIMVADLKPNPQEFAPKRAIILLEDDDRLICMYSNNYHDLIMNVFGDPTDV